MTHLSLNKVTFRAENKTLFGPVSLEWPTGGLTAVMGPNGAGKSLLLALSHGHLAADKGQIKWDGIPAADSRQTRGFVFQKPTVLRRSVADNLKFALQVINVPKTDWAHLIEAALASAALTSKASAPAAALSGGEIQRLAIARGMITNPKVLMLDEPASNLDPAATKRLETMITEVAALGTQVLLATHDLGQAKRLAKRVIFMSEGKIVENRSAKAFFESPKTQAAQNYLEGIL
jgi:tungstate transport system ATP-binding protein